ncbi:hypothetical protein [Rhabdaerophilum sp. SD176]|uniref:hypothetical protein n=1 Tax=Rhabdaerophilum sp. SD176 TaxID=2983548 RepID=UPI0024DF854F|nr:hypothetical protein [Rhabdaerophilum sp. SD176]
MDRTTGQALRLPILACAFGLAAGAALAQAPAAPAKVDLKLFDRAEIDRSKGCPPRQYSRAAAQRGDQVHRLQ